MDRILVGVDASPASVHALRRAAEEATLRDATLEVLYVIPPPEQLTAFPVPPAPREQIKGETERLRTEATEQLGRWLDEADVELDDLDVEYEVIVDRRTANAIVERSRSADLVVVGSRGRGGFAGLKLGSVSEQVTRHAKAPVLVVRESTEQ